MTRQIGSVRYDEPKTFEVASNKDDHFTGALVTGAVEDEDLTGLEADKILIISITIQSKQNLDFDVLFYSKDTKTNTDLNRDTLKAQEKLNITQNGFQIGGAGQYYMTLEDLEILYEDKDGTKELHVGLRNRSATAKNAGTTGDVVVKFEYIVRA